MSPKELIYIKDALSFEKSMETICSNNAQMLQDKELENFVTQLSTQHQQTFKKFYDLV